MFGEIKTEALERMNRRRTLLHFSRMYSELLSVTDYDRYVLMIIERVSTSPDIKQATIDMVKEIAQKIREWRYAQSIEGIVKSKCFTCGTKLIGRYIEAVSSPNAVYCGEDCFVQMGLSKGHTSHVGYDMPLAERRYVKALTWFDDPETKRRRKICKLLDIDFVPDLTTSSSMITILARLAEMNACVDLGYRPDEECRGWFCEVEGLVIDDEIYNVGTWNIDYKVSPSAPEALLKAMVELIREKELREEGKDEE